MVECEFTLVDTDTNEPTIWFTSLDSETGTRKGESLLVLEERMSLQYSRQFQIDNDVPVIARRVGPRIDSGTDGNQFCPNHLLSKREEVRHVTGAAAGPDNFGHIVPDGGGGF